jgi:hypothetical protein
LHPLLSAAVRNGSDDAPSRTRPPAPVRAGCVAARPVTDPQTFECGNNMRIVSAPWFAAH